jgi:hypothetical protein
MGVVAGTAVAAITLRLGATGQRLSCVHFTGGSRRCDPLVKISDEIAACDKTDCRSRPGYLSGNGCRD